MKNCNHKLIFERITKKESGKIEYAANRCVAHSTEYARWCGKDHVSFNFRICHVPFDLSSFFSSSFSLEIAPHFESHALWRSHDAHRCVLTCYTRTFRLRLPRKSGFFSRFLSCSLFFSIPFVYFRDSYMFFHRYGACITKCRYF